MSKITNDGLTRSGTRCFTHMATVGGKGLRHRLLLLYSLCSCAPVRQTFAPYLV